jgi:hypothetical protein
LLSETFQFSMPFLFTTKTQLVSYTSRLLPPSLIVDNTVSCEHFPQRKPNGSQCGDCFGCSLRRMAFKLNGFFEPIEGRYQNDALKESYSHQRVFLQSQYLHLRNALNTKESFNRLMELSKLGFDEQRELARACKSVTGVLENQVPHQLVSLFRRYESELCSVLERESKDEKAELYHEDEDVEEVCLS